MINIDPEIIKSVKDNCIELGHPEVADMIIQLITRLANEEADTNQVELSLNVILEELQA